MIKFILLVYMWTNPGMGGEYQPNLMGTFSNSKSCVIAGEHIVENVNEDRTVENKKINELFSTNLVEGKTGEFYECINTETGDIISAAKRK